MQHDSDTMNEIPRSGPAMASLRVPAGGHSPWPLAGVCVAVLLLCACADRPLRTPEVSSTVQAELARPVAAKPVLVPA